MNGIAAGAVALTLVIAMAGCHPAAVVCVMGKWGDDLCTSPAEKQYRAMKVEVRARELEDRKIGYQSSPVAIPRIGELRLQVFPLNTNDRLGLEPFVICLAPRWTAVEPNEKPQTLSIDARKISLILPDGSAAKPTGYVVDGICPYIELPTSSSRTLVFREINLAEPLVWGRADPASGFGDLALRFDVATPSSFQKFSLQLGALALDGVRHDLPTIEFASHYGRLSRDGNVTPNYNVLRPGEELVNCVAGGERRWTQLSKCD